MSFIPPIAGLLSMGNNFRLVLLASSLSVGFMAAAGAETRPVVLELFTSEGCSSCPPAEVIVNELAQWPSVLPLSFHVDYWDDLGWRDRYSLASATERQRVYARTLRRSSVYTPQAVIDGSRDIVGSQRAAVMQAVSGRRDGVATSVFVSSGTIQIHVGAGSDAATADVLLVGYLREATTPIGRGEAIVTSFMFVLLTPLALAALAGIVAFVGAIGAGILRIVVPLRDLPQWIFLGTAYVGIVVSVWALRDYWTGPAYEFMGLIAKAILIATQ